ncbi:MAG: hypothetical protein WCG47_25685, partial [Dermatophilaceae bacterium]
MPIVPWIIFNPFTTLGNAAGKVIADAWTTAMLSIWNAGLWLLRLVLQVEDAFLTPDLSEHGPMSGIYPVAFWVAAALVLTLVMIQMGAAALRREGRALARAGIGMAQFGMVWTAWLGYAVAVLAACSGLTRALMSSLLHVDAMSAWQPFSGFSTDDITNGAIATVLGVLGILVVFSAIAHLLILLTRAASLMVLAATGPIAAAGLVWEGGRAWWWKAFRWFHAAAFTPVLMMLMLGIGVQATSKVALGYTDSVEKAIGTAVPGVMLILVGCFAPLALFKLLAFTDPGTSSGAAMRAGMDAVGGISGLLRGLGGHGDATSDAASASSADGRSHGEASSEAAASDRLTKSTGGFMSKLSGAGQVLATGLDIASGLGARGAAVGADITNQMGVGHNTYVPDFSGRGSQTSSRSQGRPADDEHPDINGAGPPDAATPGPAVFMPGAPRPDLPSSGGGPGAQGRA